MHRSHVTASVGQHITRSLTELQVTRKDLKWDELQLEVARRHANLSDVRVADESVDLDPQQFDDPWTV